MGLSAEHPRSAAAQPSAAEWAMLRALLLEALAVSAPASAGQDMPLKQTGATEVRFQAWRMQLRWSRGGGRPAVEVSLWAGDLLLEHVRSAVAGCDAAVPPWDASPASRPAQVWSGSISVG